MHFAQFVKFPIRCGAMMADFCAAGPDVCSGVCLIVNIDAALVASKLVICYRILSFHVRQSLAISILLTSFQSSRHPGRTGIYQSNCQVTYPVPSPDRFLRNCTT